MIEEGQYKDKEDGRRLGDVRRKGWPSNALGAATSCEPRRARAMRALGKVRGRKCRKVIFDLARILGKRLSHLQESGGGRSWREGLRKHWDNRYSNERVNIARMSKKWQTTHDTVKLLENKLGENLDDLGCGDVFLDTTPKTQSVKVIVSLKLKTFALRKTRSGELEDKP